MINEHQAKQKRFGNCAMPRSASSLMMSPFYKKKMQRPRRVIPLPQTLSRIFSLTHSIKQRQALEERDKAIAKAEARYLETLEKLKYDFEIDKQKVQVCTLCCDGMADIGIIH